MLEFQKNQTKKETNSMTQTIGEEWKKYNKRMDDMIDDAEIEAEMEAEKKIRSKNSRLLTISVIGIALLILIFINVQKHPNVPQYTTDEKPLIDKASFLPRRSAQIVSQLDELTQGTPNPVAKKAKAFSKPINNFQQKVGNLIQRDTETGKASDSASINRKISAPSEKHFVQLGAFSIKKNAENFSNIIESRGFKTVISVRDKKSTKGKTYTVRVEGLATESEAEKMRQKLATHGFKNSFIR